MRGNRGQNMMLLRLLGRLPFSVLYALAAVAYLVIYYVAGYRREIVRENLKNAFPDKNERERTVLAKMFYRQLAQVAVEILKARTMSKRDFHERVSLRNPELIRQCSEDFHQSVIIMTIHQGNWEWMLHGTSAALGIPLDVIYKPLHNRAADQLMRAIRGRLGCVPVPVSQSSRHILRHRGECRLLVMAADQSPTRHERSVWTRFLHQQTAFHAGAEAIARLTDCPVLFARCRRLRRGYYEIEFQPLAIPPHHEPENTITERYAQWAQSAILAEPESWLWSNRRWKRPAPEA